MTSPSRSERASRAWEQIRTEPGLARNFFTTIALIVLAFVVGGIVLSQQRFIPPWADRLVIYATFSGTPGVSPGQGQEVRIAGVQVGQIVDATVDDSGHARLELSLQRELRGTVYDNASLVMRPKSPLNEMYVVMNPGGPPGKPVESGAVLPFGQAERPVQIDEVLGNLDENARTMFTHLMSESDVALVNAQKTLPPGLDAVRVVGNNLRPVSEELTKRKEKLRTLITALGQIAQAVGHDDKRLRQLGDSLQVSLGTLSANRDDVESTLNQLPDLLRQLRLATTEVQGLADELDPTLRNLEQASDDFPEALEALEGTSDRLDAAVDAAGPFMDAAAPVVDDLRPFAGEARKAIPALRDVSAALDPITDRLVDYIPDVSAFIVQTRSIVSATDANGGILRGVAEFSGQTAPPVLGRPNNGLRPIPDPGLSKGTSQAQQLVPTGRGGDPATPQDGSEPDEGNDQPTPGEDSEPERGVLPGGGAPKLPFGNN